MPSLLSKLLACRGDGLSSSCSLPVLQLFVPTCSVVVSDVQATTPSSKTAENSSKSAEHEVTTGKSVVVEDKSDNLKSLISQEDLLTNSHSIVVDPAVLKQFAWPSEWPPRQGAMLSFIKQSTLVHVVLLGAYLTTGLVLNALQAAVYWLVRPISKPLFRTLNRHLIYGNWAQIVSLGHWWSGSQVRVWVQDPDTARTFGREHGYVIMNHTYEIDFMFSWFICDMLDILPSCKTLAKKMISYVPVIGWNWFFGEQIFLERNWEKDRETLPAKLDNLLDYSDTMMLLMFSEGTRFTAKKHELSLKFAEERGLPKLKHHLLPRPKGFAFCAKHFHDKMNYLYDIELCVPKDQPYPPTLTSVLNGKPVRADMYVRRYALKEMPTDEEKLTKFLYKMYEEKDAIMEHYFTHQNTFPEGCVEIPFQRRLRPALIHLAMATSFVVPYCWWAANAFWLAPSVPQMVALGSFTGILYAALSRMVALTQSSKGSQYGEQIKKKQ